MDRRKVHENMLQGIIPFSHQLLEKSLKKGDIAVDATCGNGNDTLFLSRTVGSTGKIYAFDVQKQAIETTAALLQTNERKNVHLIHDSHAKINDCLPDEAKGNIAGAIFNLGYLPRSDKQVITRADSTIQAVQALLDNGRKGAIIAIVVYHGHEGGKEEKDAVLQFASALDQKEYGVLKYQFINQKNNPPFVVAIEKR